jgi:hypothetical protein
MRAAAGLIAYIRRASVTVVAPDLLGYGIEDHRQVGGIRSQVVVVALGIAGDRLHLVLFRLAGPSRSSGKQNRENLHGVDGLEMGGGVQRILSVRVTAVGEKNQNFLLTRRAASVPQFRIGDVQGASKVRPCTAHARGGLIHKRVVIPIGGATVVVPVGRRSLRIG